MSKVTQADIARALGLSPTTVGLVVGNTSSPLARRLSKETIERVRKKAEEMGYLPNRAAQIVRRGRSNLIVLLSMTGQSEVGARCAYQIGRLVHEAGFEFQTIEAYWWPGDGKRFVEQVLALRPEGVIVTGSIQTQMDFERIQRSGILMVSIGCWIPGVPFIRADVAQAFFELTTAAIAAGRERLALLVKDAQEMLWPTRERLNGFRNAVKAAGLPAPREYRYGDALPEKREPGAAVFFDTRRAQFFEPFTPGTTIAEWIGTYPDALICTNDHYAFGVMTHYLQNGVRIPGQIMVSGFDNLSFTTQGVAPLTTVEQPVVEMAEAAMRLLREWIGGTPPGHREEIYPCRIQWRRSMPKPESLSPVPKPQNLVLP